MQRCVSFEKMGWSFLSRVHLLRKAVRFFLKISVILEKTVVILFKQGTSSLKMQSFLERCSAFWKDAELFERCIHFWSHFRVSLNCTQFAFLYGKFTIITSKIIWRTCRHCMGMPPSHLSYHSRFWPAQWGYRWGSGSLGWYGRIEMRKLYQVGFRAQARTE